MMPPKERSTKHLAPQSRSETSVPLYLITGLLTRLAPLTRVALYLKHTFAASLIFLILASNARAGTGYSHNYTGQNYDIGCGWDGASWDVVTVRIYPGFVPGEYIFQRNGGGGLGIRIDAQGNWSYFGSNNLGSALFVDQAHVDSTFSVFNQPPGSVAAVDGEHMTYGGIIHDDCASTAAIHGTVTITIGDAPSNGNHTKSCEESTGCPTCSSQQGMAQYSIHLMLASLHLTDTPIRYNSPRGPSTDFTVTYNQREANQPVSFPFCNLGPKWTFNWLSYVTDDPANLGADATVYARGGGTESYTSFDSTSQSYAAEKQTLAVLVRTASGYEKRFPDGSKEIFTNSDNSTSYPRRIFLTSVVDSTGQNATTLTYDGTFRITAITDSLGQSTIIGYSPTGDTLKIVKVTDPFGRFATFDYYPNGQLWKITDPVLIKSEFQYEGTSDFINGMITPYGETKFSKGESGDQLRWLEAEDPLGGKERVEYNNRAPVASSEGASPSGVYNANLQYKNTYYWNKKAMELAPGDYSKAEVIHWLATSDGKVSGIPASRKKPLESRVWRSYTGQGDHPDLVGENARITKDVRLLDDGSPQVWQSQYNTLGNVITTTDPKGRVTSYTYSTNGIDLLAVYQRNPAGSSTDPYDAGKQADNIRSYTYDDPTAPPHLPHIFTDAAGQPTTYTYNSHGQILTVTNAKNETTTYAYGNGTAGHPLGYLDSITSPPINGNSAVRKFLYESYFPQEIPKPANRIACVIDEPDHYVVEYRYDDLDRVILISYPDHTHQDFAYGDPDRGMTLDLTKSYDRRGRLTTRHYDALRHLDSITDPLQQTTTYGWCTCGALVSITDPNHHTTIFTNDLESRVTRKTFSATTTPLAGAPGRAIDYTYEDTTSRLKSMTDSNNQVTHYSYFADDSVNQVTYTDTNGQSLASTPDVTFTYDQNYNRLKTMASAGIGITTYEYYPVGATPTKGANQLQTVGGLVSGDTVTYLYDELGRATTQSIGNAVSSVTYDVLGRVSKSDNPLGRFDRTYDNIVTPRLTSVTFPNNQITSYSYYSGAQDFRLQTIQNESGSTNLSAFLYTYDSEGQVLSWLKKLGTAAAITGNYGYDLADRLTSATTASLVAPGTFMYGYDAAGNRTSDQRPPTSHTYNEVNEITDPGFLYDGTGNLTSDGLSRYEWDAADRLVAVQKTVTLPAPAITYRPPPTPAPTPTPTQIAPPQPPNLQPPATPTPVPTPVTITTRSEFSYDGLGRRIRIVEKLATGNPAIDPQFSLSPVSDRHYIWSGNTLAEERDSANPAVILKRFFAEGEQRVVGSDAGAYYYTRDQLGSIREVTDSTGAIRAQYDYDPYGNRLKVNGDATFEADFGFTGYWFHQPSGLSLALYRPYSSTLGRWLTRDPIGESGGLNLYRYVRNDPANLTDASGLTDCAFLRARIEHNRRLLEGKLREYENNRGNLPDITPNDLVNLAESRRGHEIQIHRLINAIARDEAEYAEKCIPKCRNSIPENGPFPAPGLIPGLNMLPTSPLANPFISTAPVAEPLPLGVPALP